MSEVGAMMSEETRVWVRRIFGAGLGLAADALKDEGEGGAAVVLGKLAPALVEQLIDEIADESVTLTLGEDATATGTVDFGS